mmetsp:Transcript_29975/g.53966  ORF Transcript_29975/g.53966 Transcript_29975/m.53966 type:complete len:86 (-) Transcript_29975:41-298(-)
MVTGLHQFIFVGFSGSVMVHVKAPPSRLTLCQYILFEFDFAEMQPEPHTLHFLKNIYVQAFRHFRSFDFIVYDSWWESWSYLKTS